MRLSDYLEPDLVLVGLDTHGIEDTIHTLVGRLAEQGWVDGAPAVERAVVERERSHTTSLGNGVALPHATVAEVGRPLILVATAPAGIQFGPPVGGQAVDRLFFLLLSPLDAAGTHIKILARVVRLVRRQSFVEALIATEAADALIEEIEREDALHV